MKKKLALSFLFSIMLSSMFAGIGDTTLVTSHNNVYVVTNPSTGSNPYPLWAVFPSAGTQYRKIILNLAHRCPPGLPCGEWDYIDNVFIRRVGGANAASVNIELARYITPYGNSFNQSWNSSWTLDVTDYATFLHDSVEIEYIHTGYETNVNKGWNVSVSFSVIEGTPVMPPVAFHQLWKGSFPYGNASNPIENYLPADTITVDAATNNLKLKVTQSGHGADAAYCAEFCSKNRSVYFDGALVNTKAIWRLCGRNPIYPQGGTWVYDRANWCPGNWVYPVNYKFNNITGGSTHIVDMNMQTYATANPSANYVVDAQLYEYGALSNSNDGTIDEVMEPNNIMEFSRMNPVCNNPRIRFKNNGSNPITTATFAYGITGSTPAIYSWSGNLASLDTVQVVLPGIITPVTGSQQFKVYIQDINGGADQYPYDDTAYTTALINPVLDTVFVINFRANAAPNETSYKLWDENGNIVAQRLQGTLSANTIYKDTVYVNPGCYRFKLFDSGDDGLQWWANPNQGTGFARISRANVATQYVTFNPDFGSEISYNFRALPGGVVGVEDIAGAASLTIYPNPSQGKISVDVALTKADDITVEVLNQLGQVVVSRIEKNYMSGVLDVDLTTFDNGIYVVRLKTNDITKTEKIILQH